MKTVKMEFPVFTVEEFLELVQNNLKIDNNSLITEGFPVWDVDRPAAFIKAIWFRCDEFPTQYLLDVGDKDWIFFICQSDCTMMHK